MSTHTSSTLTPLQGQQTQDWWAQPLSCTHLCYNPSPPQHLPLPNPPNTHAHTHPPLFTPEHDVDCHNDPLATPTTSLPLPWPDEHANHLPILSNLPPSHIPTLAEWAPWPLSSQHHCPATMFPPPTMANSSQPLNNLHWPLTPPILTKWTCQWPHSSIYCATTTYFHPLQCSSPPFHHATLSTPTK